MIEPIEFEELQSKPNPVLRRAGYLVAYTSLSLWAILLVAPMAWMFLCAFTPDALLRVTPPQVSLRHLTLDNFGLMYTRSRGLFGNWFWNTLYIASVVTLISLFLNSLAGYCFARLKFPGKELIFWVLIATLMVPYQAIVLPLFVVVNNMLKLADTHWALILPQLSAPIGIFLCRQYMQTLPSDLEDAARMDGCSEFGIFLRVILPISKPVLAVLAIFTFLWNWKSFFWPLIILRTESKFVLELGLSYLQDHAVLNYGILMAGAATAAVPMIIFFLVFQKYIISGLAVGTLKY